MFAGLRGLLGAGLTLGMFAAARSLYGGFGSAAPPAVQAYVASRTPRAERTKALALIASSFGLGTVIGPAIAPLLILPGKEGLAGPFFVFAGFGVLVLIALRLRLPDDDPTYAARGQIAGAPFSASVGSASPGPDAEDEALAGDIPDLHWRDSRLRPWLVAGLLGGHAQAALLGLAGFFVLDRLGLRGDPAAGAGPVGTVLMAGAGATLLAQWGLIPNLNMGPRTSLLAGMALALVGTICFALAYDLPHHRARLRHRFARVRALPARLHLGREPGGQPRRAGPSRGDRRVAQRRGLHRCSGTKRVALQPPRSDCLRGHRRALRRSARLGLARARKRCSARRRTGDRLT